MSQSCISSTALAQKVSDEIIDAIATLINTTRSLQLATKSENDEALSSYTPFILHDDHFYIFVSELASHTQNLLRNAFGSVMLIEDEAQAKNIFARKRLITQCQVKEVNRQSDDAEALLDQMQSELGNTISVLRTLPDFHLFELLPIHGNYVQGFGQAFEI